jgi:hypothetical protein
VSVCGESESEKVFLNATLRGFLTDGVREGVTVTVTKFRRGNGDGHILVKSGNGDGHLTVTPGLTA